MTETTEIAKTAAIQGAGHGPPKSTNFLQQKQFYCHGLPQEKSVLGQAVPLAPSTPIQEPIFIDVVIYASLSQSHPQKDRREEKAKKLHCQQCHPLEAPIKFHSARLQKARLSGGHFDHLLAPFSTLGHSFANSPSVDSLSSCSHSRPTSPPFIPALTLSYSSLFLTICLIFSFFSIVDVHLSFLPLFFLSLSLFLYPF